MTAVTLNLDAITTLSHEQFWELSLTNRDVRLELTAQGKLIEVKIDAMLNGKLVLSSLEIHDQIGTAAVYRPKKLPSVGKSRESSKAPFQRGSARSESNHPLTPGTLLTQQFELD